MLDELLQSSREFQEFKAAQHGLQATRFATLRVRLKPTVGPRHLLFRLTHVQTIMSESSLSAELEQKLGVLKDIEQHLRYLFVHKQLTGAETKNWSAKVDELIVQMSDQEITEYLSLFGLEHSVTDEDDPTLWASVLMGAWPLPDSPNIHESSLLFGLAQVDWQRELRLHLPFKVFRFERSTNLKLRVIDNSEKIQGLHSAGKSPTLMTLEVNRSYPYRTLILPRPSTGQQRVPVYSDIRASNTTGHGATNVWEFQGGKLWARKDPVLARDGWIS